MLVYANLLRFEPEDGRHQLIRIFSNWLSRKVRRPIDADRVEHGIRELNLPGGSMLKTSSTPFIDEENSYPFLFNAEFSHGDQQVPGRRWILEFGMRQHQKFSTVDCSILLRTDDKSVTGNPSTFITRPRYVQDLVEACRPISQTPGLFPKKLDHESCIAYLGEVERTDRPAPLVVISPYNDGGYPLDPEYLRNQVLGLAHVVVISSPDDYIKMEDEIGRRYLAFDGGLKIIWPYGHRSHHATPETTLLLPDQPGSSTDPNVGLERRVLIELTKRLNHQNSLRHISSDDVAEATLRAKMYADMAKIRMASGTKNSKEYEELLDHADAELRGKDEKIDNLSSQNITLEAEVVRLQAELDRVRSMSPAHSKSDLPADSRESGTLMREAVLAMHNGSMSLYQALEMIQVMFPERITVLPSAFSSAKESDAGMFRHPEKAFSFLSKLATDYWEILANGGSEQQAKGAFGPNAYSATENNLTTNGKKLRTFLYDGNKVLMEKHLKYGVKDSLATTLRIHFKWFDAEGKVVIGHCGKHLDF